MVITLVKKGCAYCHQRQIEEHVFFSSGRKHSTLFVVLVYLHIRFYFQNFDFLGWTELFKTIVGVLNWIGAQVHKLWLMNLL